MKNLKRITVALLILVMAFGVAGCGSDPVAEEFENFLNVEMVEPNANYEEVQALAGQWDSFEDDASWIENVEQCIAYVTDSKEIVSGIELTTVEVQALKDTYLKMLDEYIDGFTKIRDGIVNVDEALLEEGGTLIETGMTTLEEYNAGLEALAAEKGMEIQY